MLDGAWGTMLQNARLTPEDYRADRFDDHRKDVTGDPDLLNLTRPDVVLDVHRQYLAAGADITTTNTFTATSIGQADYGLQHLVREMNIEARRLARQAADEVGGRFVAGSIGPLNVTLSLSPKVEDPAYRAVTFDQVRDAYAEQISALAEGGVDLLLIETIFDTLNAKAAIAAAREVAPAPAAVDLGDHRRPERADAVRADRRGVLALRSSTRIRWSSGVNCSLGAAEMRPHVADLSRLADTYVAATRTPACRTRSAATTRPRTQTAALLGEFAAGRPASTSSAAAAAPPRRTSPRSPRRSRACAPRHGARTCPAHPVQRPGAVRDRRPTPAS